MDADPRAEQVEADDGPEVPLCLSCWTPRSPREDFCASCGAPVSTLATAGAFETIRAVGWALGASGRWEWTRSLSLLAAWSYALGEAWALSFVLERPVLGERRSWAEAFLLVPLLAWLTVLGLVLRYVTLRWWRLRGTPDPTAPDEITPDPA